jgi:hypothetical protein
MVGLEKYNRLHQETEKWPLMLYTVSETTTNLPLSNMATCFKALDAVPTARKTTMRTAGTVHFVTVRHHIFKRPVHIAVVDAAKGHGPIQPIVKKEKKQRISRNM